MTKYGTKHSKIKQVENSTIEILEKSESWKAVAKITEEKEEPSEKPVVFVGKVLQGGNFSGENLKNADFTGSNMQEINLSKANLENADFTGADLSGADLSEANLDGAVFDGAKLIGTNFTGAHMHGVSFKDADLQDAILLDADLDSLSIEELQELIEYLAQYYPHKLNLTRLNLTMLDLRRIDLRKVNLRGVDFTGCNFFGVNIYELDLSECIISPAQIEQAIGHQPTPEELKKIFAPKRKNKAKSKMNGIDFGSLFNEGGSFDWDATKGGTDVTSLVKSGKELLAKLKKEDSDEDIINKFNEHKAEHNIEPKENNNEELRKSIEQYKKEVLEQRKEQQINKEKNMEEIKEKIAETKAMINSHKSNER